jgi:hypothetical protein
MVEKVTYPKENNMDLVTLVIGVVVGAVFSPFWMKVWNMVKGWFTK